MTEKLKRYLIFIVGLFISSFGVSFITKANLGTSPISSIPYVLSLKFTWTLGNFTIAFSVFLIILQIIILRKKFKLESLLQVPVSIFFGYFIDFTMLLLKHMNPQQYGIKIISLLIGCVILAFGVYLEVLADVVMLPGESFVRCVVQTWNTNFGNTKVVFDASMCITAAALSFVFFHGLEGVREGTLIAALIVGFIARIFGRIFSFVEPLLFPQSMEIKEDTQVDEGNTVICISREYGSGGHDIAKALAKKLGYGFYDHQTSRLTADTTGFTQDYVLNHEEKMTSGLLYDFVHQEYGYSAKDLPPKDEIFKAEEQLIKNFAKEGNCVIVGRCADYILRHHKNVYSIFFHADLNYRCSRIMSQDDVSSEEAKARIKKEDRLRASNYHYYTRQIWGMAKNYDMTIDTTYGADYIIREIIEMMKHKSKI